MTTAIEKAFQVFEAIEATTSKTVKEDLLKANKDNEVLKELLVLTYNPFITFGIKKDPKVAPSEGEWVKESNFNRFVVLLDRLLSRTVTGFTALDETKAFFMGCSEREYKWYLKALQRDLKIGITDKTINKAIKGLVPVFTCALANSWEPKKTPKRFVADTKKDGYRCLAFNYSDRVELRSRNGHLLEGYAGIEKDVAEYLPKGFMYDGEIVGRQGSFNEIQKSAFKKDTNNKDGVLAIFDVVQVEEFESNDFKYPYEGRLAFLDQITDILEGARSLDRVYQTRPLESSKPEDMESLLEFHRDNVLRGEEGTMIKDLGAKYKMDKSNNILKMKDFYDIDLEVVGVYEGKEGTKYQGMMGGIYVLLSDKDLIEQCPVNDPKHKKKLQYIEGLTVKAKVGSGWSNPDRINYWENPNLIIGKTIEISFQETTLNEKGAHDFRFATLVKIRDDK